MGHQVGQPKTYGDDLKTLTEGGIGVEHDFILYRSSSQRRPSCAGNGKPPSVPVNAGLTKEQDAPTKPQCFPEYGIARLDETTSNIDHLNDVAAQDAVCVAEPGTCARPSHLGHSSIFMCNQVRFKNLRWTWHCD
jgi:hypothetical protein